MVVWLSTSMLMFKKLFFAPFFLLVLFITLIYSTPILGNISLLLSLDLSALIPIIVISLGVLLSGLLFAVFVTFCQDIRLILIVALLGSLLPLFQGFSATSLIEVFGLAFSFFMIAFVLQNKLNHYLNFQPTVLLIPSIKNIATILCLTLSFAYFFAVRTTIQTHGIQIPDNVINPLMQFSNPLSSDSTASEITNQLQEQDSASMLSQLGSGALNSALTDAQQTAKTTLENQINQEAKTYEPLISATLALLFFLTINSTAALLAFLLYPTIWLLFKLLEEIEFSKFVVEMREVKKLVV